MKYRHINKIKIFAPENRMKLIDFAFSEKKILIAINTQKILNATPEIVDLININIGYPDGIGAVWGLKKKGLKNAIKIPGCELWLEIVAKFYLTKSIYIIGGSQEVIDNTALRLRLL